MNPSARAFRVGLFLVLGIVLLVTAIAFVLGGQLFTAREPVLMRFNGSVYGLKTGSPVVFRGVNIGTVTSLGLAQGSQAGSIEIPVTAMLNRDSLLQLGSPQPTASQAIQALLSQGLSARLANQSLLTGQLYVDLDLRPSQVKPGAAAASVAGDVPDIPTLPSTTQALQAQLEGVDIKAALQDVAAIAKATRQILQDPQLKTTLDNAAKLSAELRALAQSLQREVKPLSGTAQTTLVQAGTAASALAQAASRIAQVAQRLDSTLAPDSALMQSFQVTAKELGQTAANLRNTTGEDSELVNNLNRAATDVARAARQMGDLAELLERQPDALLRGRAVAP
ncbi:MCE family protein [Rhodoferax sp. 4810]|nr:MCE family protein [Rhodoferax jenense]